MNRRNYNAFWRSMNERERIRTRRAAGESPPWTNDNVLRTHHFTNVNRFHDAVTQFYWRQVYGTHKNRPVHEIIFNTIFFRAFNWPPTWQALGWQRNVFDSGELKARLDDLKSGGAGLFTNAYVITAGGHAGPKHYYVIDAMRQVFEDRIHLAEAIVSNPTMEATTKRLTRYPTLGMFTGYEVACDLAYTPVLSNAPDQMTWANPGPGARRGLRQIFNARPNTKEAIEQMRRLLHDGIEKERWVYQDSNPLNMRCIEHWLCEFQKYLRGGSKNRYRADKPGTWRKL